MAKRFFDPRIQVGRENRNGHTLLKILPSLDKTPAHFEHVFRAARASGAQAATAVTPPLMIVTDPDTILLPAGPDHVPGLWFVPEGPAGTAMIVLQPATCRFARWLLKQGHAHRVYGRRGAVIYADSDGQSIHRAAAYATAFVAVIAHEPLSLRAEIVLRYC